MTQQVLTLALAAAVGVVMVAVATRLKVPSIVLLLLVGVGLGPEGAGIIDPWILGRGLPMVVGLIVAVVLFEGALTLDLQGARRASVVIVRLLTVGVLITWWGTALAVWLIFDVPAAFAVLAGSLVIVTGPTVVSPLLRRLNVVERLKHILYWEAVLGDAVGVFIAILCLEWLGPGSSQVGSSPLLNFAYRVGIGSGLGLIAGLGMAAVLRYRLIPDAQLNVFVLAMAVLTYAFSEVLLHEAGILAVIVAGFTLGLLRTPQLIQLKRFKLEIAELGIGMLFILLAATLRLEPFLELGWRLVGLLAVVLLLLRPLGVVAATVGRPISIQDKLFLAWTAPRGIVAAFMASLFALELSKDIRFVEHAEFLQTFTFAVIGTTVILQGLSAPLTARLLGVVADAPRRTWLFTGDPDIAVPLVRAANQAGGRAVALVAEPLAGAPRGLPGRREDELVVVGSPLDPELAEDPRLSDVGSVLAASGNVFFNQLVAERWSQVVGADRCYWWGDDDDLARGQQRVSGRRVWGGLGRPGEVATALEAGAAALVRVEPTGDTDQFGAHQRPLFTVQDGVVRLVAANERPRDGVVLALRKRVPGLSGLVRGAMCVEGEASFGEVVERLLALAAVEQHDLPTEAILEGILERERSLPTTMGGGIAIPHAYHESIESSQCFVAAVPAGIAAGDGTQIRLLFLVLSPKGRAEEHLQSLAAIARLANEPEYLEILERQETDAQLLARIQDRS